MRAVAPEEVTKIVHTAGDAAVLAALLKSEGHLASAIGADPASVGRDDVTISALVTAATAEKLTSLLDLVASGQLTVPASATYPPEQARDALAQFGSGKLGKVVVTVQ